ncbi:MAG: hypothetical protein IPF66_02410 [Holophagales bacterium]|nr:hypothetical protein [Holophagales bacterium]
MKPFASMTSVGLALTQFALRAAVHWFTHATSTDLRNPQIYESVRLVVARNWATVWRIRLATGQRLGSPSAPAAAGGQVERADAAPLRESARR